MYVYQNGKLYVHLGENDVVGVEIYPDKIVKVEGTETKLSDDYELFTPSEVQSKFNIVDGESYIFPAPKKKEVVDNEPTGEVKKPTRKSTRK